MSSSFEQVPISTISMILSFNQNVTSQLHGRIYSVQFHKWSTLSFFFQAEYNGLYCYNGMTSAHETFTRGLGSLPINKNGKKIFFSKMFDISLKFHYDEPAPPKT